MRKLFICLLIGCFWLAVCSADAAKNTQKEKRFKASEPQQEVVEEEKTNNHKKISKKSMFGCGQDHPIRVAGFVTNAPFGWVNIIPAKGMKPEQYVNGGFSYDLFEQIVTDAGLKIQNVGYTSYQEAMRDLRRGKIDVVAGGYFDNRMLGAGVNLMFPSYFTNPIIPIFLNGKEKEVRSWDDLKGLKGVVRQEENIYSLIFNQLPKEIEIKQVSGSKKAFTMLLKGEADYILTSLYAGESEVRRFKLTGEVYFSPKALVSAELFFVFSSHSDCPAIKKKLEPILRKLKENDDAYRKTFIGYIDEWGLRFQNAKGLKQELYEEEQKIAVSTENVDQESNTIASDSPDPESDLPDQAENEKTESASNAPTETNGVMPSGDSAQPTQPTQTTSSGDSAQPTQSAQPDVQNKSNESAQKQPQAAATSNDKTSVKKSPESKEAPKEEKPNRPLTAAERIRNL